ncbi:MAG: hypothetical protein NT165_03110 [Candidatus Falkowbacteria bacterium]|nr:hypothetical protein [Candidatus Falkowbacteria bacterium]
MKIVICGSMKFSFEMLTLKSQLNALGFNQVIVPHNTEKYASHEWGQESRAESTENKINHDLIRAYYQEIFEADAVLVANYDKNGVNNYVGGNSFLEAAFAHVLRKDLYFLHEVPDMSYSDEMRALQPIVLDGDLQKIKR